jgi:hypothetical protein
MASDGVPAQLRPVTDRLTQVAEIVGKVVRPAMVAGLIATVVIGLALIPWLFHGPVAIVCWAVIVGVGVAASLRLTWHSRLLRKTLGSPEFLVRSLTDLNQSGSEHAKRLARQLDDVTHADKGTKLRSAFKMLRDIRNLSAIKELGDSANDIVAPISVPRLVLSGYAVAIVLGAVLLAIPVMFVSLIGLALR